MRRYRIQLVDDTWTETCNQCKQMRPGECGTVSRHSYFVSAWAMFESSSSTENRMQTRSEWLCRTDDQAMYDHASQSCGDLLDQLSSIVIVQLLASFEFHSMHFLMRRRVPLWDYILAFDARCRSWTKIRCRNNMVMNLDKSNQSPLHSTSWPSGTYMWDSLRILLIADNI